MESTRDPWIDVSVGIESGMPVWPGDPSPLITRVASFEGGDDYQLSEAFFGLHSGTHIDAPLHFIPGGKCIAEIALHKLVGLVRVLDATSCKLIDAAWLSEKSIEAGERLFFKTCSSTENRNPDPSCPFRALDDSAARYLVDKKIEMAGIDGLSIAILQQLKEVHVTLLNAEIVIVENLDLQKISEGYFEMLCLPVKISGAEAAPARVLLRKKS